MQLTHVGYGGCWKWRHARHRWSDSTRCLADSQNGFVHSLGTGMGRVTLLQSLIGALVSLCAPRSSSLSRRRGGAAGLVEVCGAAVLEEPAHRGVEVLHAEPEELRDQVVR